MGAKEAKARIKINKLLEGAGWLFFDTKEGKANIRLESNTKITEGILNELGEDFQKTKNGFIDFLLLDQKGFPLLVLEAKSEDKNPLDGKEKARSYAKSQNVRFVILSNGNLHYFWDLESGNPHIITTFPTPDSVSSRKRYKPNPENIIKEKVEKIKAFFEKSQNTNVGFVTSDWTLTEIVKVLIKDKRISPKKTGNYIQEVERTSRLEGIKFVWIPVSRKKGYDFDEFFYEIQKIQLQYKGSLGDAIHGLIMKNNLVQHILTTDSEFGGMRGMIVINPLKQD